MHRARRFTGVALGTTLLLTALTLGSSAGAQETRSQTLQFSPSRDSGVSGTGTFKDVEDGVEVTLKMRDLPTADVDYLNHIHGNGTCADDEAGRGGPVTIPLKTVVANDDGTGSATTTVEGITVAQLFDSSEERYINLHDEAEEGGGTPPGISCADFITGSGLARVEETSMRETTRPLPKSGGPVIGSPSVLLPAAALFLGSGIVAFAILRRR